MVNEKSFVCKEKPVYWDYMDGHTKNTLDGKYIAVTSPGTSLIYFPSLAIANIFNEGHTIENDYFMSYNGHTLYDGIAILFTVIIINIISFIIIYKTLLLLKYSKKTIIFSLSVITISSYLLWYVFLLPIFTHTSEVFIISLILYTYLKYLSTNINKYLILLSGAIGFSVLIRPILLPIGCFFLLSILSNNFKTRFTIKDLKIFMKKAVIIFISALPFVLIYLIYNYQSYSSFVTSGYNSARSESFVSEFNGINILFSPFRGWFTYSPIMLLATIGLALLYKKRRSLSIISLLSILIIVCIYGFWPNWWGGGSFGSRFLLFSVPLCTLGLAELLESLKSKGILTRYAIFILTFLFSLYSFNLMFLYRITPIGADFYTPLFFYKHQINTASDSVSIKDFIKSEKNNIQTGSGLLILGLGISNPVILVQKEQEMISFRLIKAPFNNKTALDNIEGKIFLTDPKKPSISFYIKTINTSDILLISCAQSCTTKNTKIIINESSPDRVKHKFLVSDYSGFSLDEVGSIILARKKGVQYRGSTINWNPDTPYYEF